MGKWVCNVAKIVIRRTRRGVEGSKIIKREEGVEDAASGERREKRSPHFVVVDLDDAIVLRNQVF